MAVMGWSSITLLSVIPIGRAHLLSHSECLDQPTALISHEDLDMLDTELDASILCS